ncbi:MATE family efflux transporter [Rhodohalobacter mucosus]|uniref:Multidrug-efflux transporter n=1 Tax=Rhodohalobacter mucosus TaxID=2079485 RepID=A0A316TSK6_9BACT|nr:MATE family efflux transporter [Rhodohalobacter mucosus]PWN05222.1 MATE family efflux transporter [Rhodohalobacter mucosus]
MPSEETTYKQRIRSEISSLMKIGTPVIIAQLLQMSMSFVDTVMAGRLSPQDLAAVAVGSSIMLPFMVLCLGCIMAVTPIVAQNVGGRRFKQIGKNARQVLWLSQILALPSFFLLRHLDATFPFIGVTDEIIPIAGGYLRAMSWGIFPFYAFSALRNFNEGLSVTRPAMYIAAIGLMVNIPGNYILMFGKLGFPQLGAVGTGYSSSIVGAVMFVFMLIFTIKFQPFQRFGIFDKFRWPEKKYLSELLRIGVPIGISSTMEVTMFAVVSLLVSTISTIAIAGHQIAINFAAMAFMIPFGLSVAISSRVGLSIGRKRPGEARFRGFVGVGVASFIMFCTAALMYLFPESIVAIYTDDPQVTEIAVQLLFMAAIFQLSDGLQVSGFGALRGLKDTKVPMYVNLFAYWIIGIPTAYLLGFKTGMGAPGLWVGLIAGLTIAGILHNLRFHIKTGKMGA